MSDLGEGEEFQEYGGKGRSNSNFQIDLLRHFCICTVSKKPFKTSMYLLLVFVSLHAHSSVTLNHWAAWLGRTSWKSSGSTPLPVAWTALNLDEVAKGLVSSLLWILPTGEISQTSWVPLPASNHPHGKNRFLDLQSRIPLLQLVYCPPKGPHPCTASTHPRCQEGVRCQGLGLPPVSPRCPSPGWGSGMGPGCQNLPCWLELEETTCSKLTSLQVVSLNLHKHAAKAKPSSSSSSEPALSYVPLQLSTSEATDSHLQQNTHGPQSGWILPLLVPTQIQCSLHRISSEHRRRPCLKLKASTNTVRS